MMTTTEVFVRDVSNHRIHRRYRKEGVRGLYSLETDNADSSGAFVVLTEAEFAEADRESFCKRCFPEDVEE